MRWQKIKFIVFVNLLCSTFAAHYVEPILRQEHFIEDDGKYKYGFMSNDAARDETRGADGITRGYYSYIDDLGNIQYVRYTAGDDGYKVEGTNLPVQVGNVPETPEVIAARTAHETAYNQARKSALEQQRTRTTEFVQNIVNNFKQIPSISNQISNPSSSNINLFSGEPLGKSYNNNNFHYQSQPTPIPDYINQIQPKNPTQFYHIQPDPSIPNTPQRFYTLEETRKPQTQSVSKNLYQTSQYNPLQPVTQNQYQPIQNNYQQAKNVYNSIPHIQNPQPTHIQNPQPNYVNIPQSPFYSIKQSENQNLFDTTSQNSFNSLNYINNNHPIQNVFDNYQPTKSVKTQNLFGTFNNYQSTKSAKPQNLFDTVARPSIENQRRTAIAEEHFNKFVNSNREANFLRQPTQDDLYNYRQQIPVNENPDKLRRQQIAALAAARAFEALTKKF